MQTFTPTVSGTYFFTVAGASGARSSELTGAMGGQGATVTAMVFLTAGVGIPIIVGAEGSKGGAPGYEGHGGGGLSTVYTNGAGNLPTIVAGMVESLPILDKTWLVCEGAVVKHMH